MFIIIATQHISPIDKYSYFMYYNFPHVLKGGERVQNVASFAWRQISQAGEGEEGAHGQVQPGQGRRGGAQDEEAEGGKETNFKVSLTHTQRTVEIRREQIFFLYSSQSEY